MWLNKHPIHNLVLWIDWEVSSVQTWTFRKLMIPFREKVARFINKIFFERFLIICYCKSHSQNWTLRGWPSSYSAWTDFHAILLTLVWLTFFWRAISRAFIVRSSSTRFKIPLHSRHFSWSSYMLSTMFT